MTLCCLADLIALLDEMAAFSLAESWDNVGLMVGNPKDAVSGILVCLDASPLILEEAEEKDCNVIVTHHPVIFRPLKALRMDDPVGSLLAEAVRREVAIVSCHTNLDVVTQGVSWALADALGLEQGKPLDAREPEGSLIGFGMIGQLAEPLSGKVFVRHLMEALSLAALKVAGPVPEVVQTIAVCGGSGSELIALAQEKGADLFVTGEVKHSHALWSHAKNFCVVDAGHFATEQVVVPVLAKNLALHLQKKNMQVQVVESRTFADPFSYFLKTEDDVLAVC